MSIFERIRSAIFRRGETNAQGAGSAGATGQSASGAVNRAPAGAGGSEPASGGQARTASAGAPQASQPARTATPGGGGNVAGASAATPAATAPAQPVDVEAVLENLAREKKQPLNWRKSIVDLMKLLDMDSSVAERRKLAKELGYTGSADDSAAMNVWLHKQVMRKLAENGGTVPAELRD